MEGVYESLVALQDLDREIAEAEAAVAAFAPRFDELVAPVVALEQEYEAAKTKLAELRDAVRRLERAAADKREKLRRYLDHLDRARTVREDAAARAEVGLVERAIEADEAEALDLMEQSRRVELRIDELEGKLGEARDALEPRRQELEAERAAAVEALAALRQRRERHVAAMAPNAVRLYERVRSGRTKVAVAALMPDGACSHCFGIVPLQQQAEIRRGGELRLCEACGVILYPAR